MKEYYASKTKLIIILVFMVSCIYGLFIIDHTKISEAIALYILMLSITIAFGTLALQHFKRLTQPVLTIKGDRIIIVDESFNRKVINDLTLIKIFICKDYITFVEPKKQDIHLIKDEFSEVTFATILTDLELLPFKEIIK